MQHLSLEDKMMIRAALLAYAEATESSPIRHYVPEGTKRQADRCRELAEHFNVGMQREFKP